MIKTGAADSIASSLTNHRQAGASNSHLDQKKKKAHASGSTDALLYKLDTTSWVTNEAYA
jgi:hypothetical protein